MGMEVMHMGSTRDSAERRPARRLLRHAQVEGVSAGVKKAAAVVAAVILLIAVARWLPSNSGEGFEIVPASEAPAATGDAGPSGASAARKIVVHVAGEVNVPGVYELAAPARVTDAVEAAGGFTQDAAPAAINLAREIEDGEQVIVPSQEAASTAVAAAPAGSGPSGGGGLVNINTATSEELQALPGIGPATAAAIIAHRSDNGSFRAKEDIQEVSGIGEGKYSRIASLICV